MPKIEPLKYRLYTRLEGYIDTIMQTKSPVKVSEAYFASVHSGGLPRISIDGHELRIFEADKFAARHVIGAHRPVEIARKRERHA